MNWANVIVGVNTETVDRIESMETTLNDIQHTADEINRHIHNVEHWLGAGGSWDTLTGIVLTCGNNDYGAWTQILTPSDIPFIAGNIHIDIHRMLVLDCSALADTTPTKIQIAWYGEDDVASAVFGDFYSEIVYLPEKDGNSNPVDIRISPIAINSYVWARIWISGKNAQTNTVMFGAHEYHNSHLDLED